MKSDYVPISITKQVKEKLVGIQGQLMQDLRRKISLSETLDFLIKFYKT
jgi:hypothetical protein